MPFGYLMDLWRWDVFDGTTPRVVFKLMFVSYWLKIHEFPPIEYVTVNKPKK